MATSTLILGVPAALSTSGVCLARRELVACAVTLAAAAATGGGTLASNSRRGLLAGLVSDHEAAHALGRAYLAGGGDPARLRSMLEALAAAGQPGLEATRRFVSEQRQADFARHEVAVVDGWVLARAEAELLALIASA